MRTGEKRYLTTVARCRRANETADRRFSLAATISGNSLREFTQKSGAPVLKKIIESAVANARLGGVDVDLLFVSKATVDKAPNKFNRRWRPRAMGRATRVAKGVSHIHLELDER